jgi:hypothetical protein
MARSIAEINDLILAKKSEYADLDALDSTSTTAVWRLWAWVTSAVIFSVEIMFDLFKSELGVVIATRKPGTLLWYQAVSKAFQYTDGLVWSDLQYGYSVFDASKQIISYCAVRDGIDGLVVKIAKTVDGRPSPLLPVEEGAFQAYIQKVKYAGTRLLIVNSPANLLRVEMKVYYEPMILNATGLSLNDGSKPVEIAINSYLTQLPFDGRLQLSKLAAAIISVDGVQDVYIVNVSQKYGALEYTPVLVSKVPEAGYFEIDPLYPLSSTLTYEAYV